MSGSDDGLHVRMCINPNLKGTTWTVTPSLRWLKPPLSTPPPKLQQAWRCLETGETEWKDVPTEKVRGVYCKCGHYSSEHGDLSPENLTLGGPEACRNMLCPCRKFEAVNAEETGI